jgi:hypothetical protein
MSTPEDEKNKKQQGSGRPATKFMERPKPGKKDPSKSDFPSEEVNDEESKDVGGEQYWGQGRQQKEQKDREQGKQGWQEPAEN